MRTFLSLFIMINCIIACKPSADKVSDDTMGQQSFKLKTIQSTYDTSAYLIIDDGDILNDIDEIDTYNRAMPSYGEVTDTSFLAHVKRKIKYSVSDRRYENGAEQKRLTIWQSFDDGQVRKVLEYVADHKEVDLYIDLDDLRDQWMQICSKHNPDSLVRTMYSDNTLYYNHKPLVRGQEALIEEYAYMANKNYQLQLTPEYVEQVNANTIYEIGQCSKSYNGKYILVWKKNDQDEWKIFLDSNI